MLFATGGGRDEEKKTESPQAPPEHASAPLTSQDPPISLVSSLMDAATYGRLLHDEEGAPCDWVILDANDAFLRLFAIPEPVGKKYSEVAPAMHREAPELLEMCARVVSTGTPERLERFFPGWDKWIDVRVASLEPAHFLAVYEDITERKRLEQSLLVTKQTVEWSPDLIQWIDRNGRMLYVNEANTKLLGYSREELESMHIWDVDTRLDPETFRRQWDEIPGPQHGLQEALLRGRDGREHVVEIASARLATETDYGIAFIRDISDRKRTEDSLARTQFSLNHIGDYPIWLDPEGHILEVSESTCRHLEYSRDELLNMTIFDIDPITWDAEANKPAESFRAFWERFEEGATQIMEQRHRAKSGRLIDVEVSLTYVSLAGRRYQCSFCRDISARKKLEQSLRFTQVSLERTPDLVHWADESGRIVYANEATCRLLGYSKDEMESLYLWDIAPELTPPTYHDRWVAPDSPGGISGHVTAFLGKDGRRHEVEISHTFVALEGRRLGVTIARDITERKAQEEKLLRTQYSLDHIGDYPLWVAPGGRIAEVSESTCRHLEYSREELLGMTIFDVDPSISRDDGRTPSAESLEALKHSPDGGAIIIESTHFTKSGKEIPVEVSINIVNFGGVEYQCSFCRDISERKAVEEKLLRTQYSLDNMLDYAIWTDREGQICEVTLSACRQLGYSREELLEMTVFDVDGDLDREAWSRHFSEGTPAGSQFVERRHRRKNGEVFPVEIATSHVSFGGQEYDCGFCRDISDRKRLERSLRMTQYSVDHSSDMIYWIDRSGRYVYANEAACRASGYSLEQIKQMHVWDINPNLSKDGWAAGWQVIREGGPRVHETVERSGDGREYPVEVISQHLEFEGHEYGVSINRDISERKLSEQLLRDGEERYRQLFELESDARMLIDDEDYSILEANQATAHLYGYSREELLGMTLLQLSDEPDKTRLVREGPSVDVPLRWHRKKDGSVFPIEGRSRQFNWKGRPVRVVAIRDITERRLVEQSLRLTRHAIDQAEDMVYWMDPEGLLLYANQATCDLLGYSLEEITALHIQDLVPGGTTEKFRENWQAIVERGSTLVEDIWQDKDGHPHPVEISSSHFLYEGKVYGVSSAREISQRKLAEQTLRDSEERYRQLFELESDALVLAEDGSRNILEVNQATVSLYGYSRAELLSMKDTELFAEPAEASRRAGAPILDTALHYHRKKDGTIFPVEVRGSHFEWKSNPVHVAAIRDITERKESEAELEESRRMMRLVLDTVPLRIAWRDRNLRYMGCNIAVALDARLPDTSSIVGLRDDDLPWRNTSPESLADDLEVIQSGIPRLQYDETIIPSEGPPRVMRSSKVPLRDRSDKIIGVLSVHEDITERVQTLEALRDREEQLRQAQKMEAIGRLAGGIAHDFNNVLTTIIGYSDLILSSEEPDIASVKEDLGEIKAAAERASNLTKQILAFSRRQALQPQVLLLNTLISQTERLLTRSIGADIELKTILNPNLGMVEVDEHQFVQILLNLAVNARDAMPEGGVLTLETRNAELDEAFCRINPDAHPGHYVVLAVSDTGTGMDPETAAHVFEPFYTTKPTGQGTGLGLSTVYGVVTQSGGCITLESVMGRGTTFCIYLPRFDHPAVEPGEEPAGVDASAKRPTIMVVDDDATFRTVTVRLLEKRGYRVLPVGDGDRAVELLRNHDTAIDLLLTDVVLPGSLQGGHIGQMAASLRPGLPVVYMSAYTRDTIVQAGRIPEGVEFLEKPFTAEHLVRQVRESLGSP